MSHNLASWLLHCLNSSCKNILASSHTLEWFRCINEVAVSLLSNMWRFYGVPDLAREGIKKWKWQVPWCTIKYGGNISNADAPGMDKHILTLRALYTHTHTRMVQLPPPWCSTMKNRLLFSRALSKVLGGGTEKIQCQWMCNTISDKCRTNKCSTSIHSAICVRCTGTGAAEAEYGPPESCISI